MFKTASIIITAIILLQGCSASFVKQKQQQPPADVTSSPSGATVYAGALKLGKTPLRYKLYKAFPASWKGGMYQAQGVLILKMDGCEDYTLRVSDNLLKKPVYAKLKCTGVSQPETSSSHCGAAARLKQIKTLYKNGLVTKAEYNAARKRVLNEL